MTKLTKVISGGQTGVDQAALRAARDCGLQIGGWCPPGRVSEAGVIPAEFPLRETEQERSPEAPDVPRSQRTEWNVRDSDGTLVITARREGGALRPPSLASGAVNSEAVPEDAGTAWAIRCAERYGRPLLVCNAEDPHAAGKIRRWLAETGIETVSVGGPSESSAPGIGDKTYALLQRVFEKGD